MMIDSRPKTRSDDSLPFRWRSIRLIAFMDFSGIPADGYVQSSQTFDSVWNKTRTFMAGWRSVLVRGKVVRLEDVPSSGK
jgi:hypothetical protein